MDSALSVSNGHARTLFAALLGAVLGAALQLQQPNLWSGFFYGSFVALALFVYALAAIRVIAIHWRMGLALVAMGLLGFGVTGLRATLYLADTLDPALEGRDLRVTGVVANLPQRNESGLRFRLQVESATLDGQPTPVPRRMDVGWYGGAFSAGPSVVGDADSAKTGEADVPVAVLNRQPGNVKAGERWEMTLRFKAPHGSRNPHGFDYELWLWEQGVQATGYVRASIPDRKSVV